MKFTTMRSTSLAILGLAALAAAQAQNVQVRSENATQARANLDASMKAAARGQKIGMTTGQRNPQSVTMANGAVAQELDAGTMMYSVARRNADGSIELVCVNGEDATKQAMKAPVFAKRVSQVAKEQSHVK